MGTWGLGLQLIFYWDSATPCEFIKPLALGRRMLSKITPQKTEQLGIILKYVLSLTTLLCLSKLDTLQQPSCIAKEIFPEQRQCQPVLNEHCAGAKSLEAIGEVRKAPRQGGFARTWHENCWSCSSAHRKRRRREVHLWEVCRGQGWVKNKAVPPGTASSTCPAALFVPSELPCTIWISLEPPLLPMSTAELPLLLGLCHLNSHLFSPNSSNLVFLSCKWSVGSYVSLGNQAKNKPIVFHVFGTK